MQEPTSAATSQATAKPAAAGQAIIIAVLTLVVGAGAFVGGMQYQKGQSGSTASASSMQAGAAGQPTNAGGGQQINGSMGAVTEISGDSIGVKDQRANTTTTYSINSGTTITNGGSSASYSDISVGDTVMVQTDSAASTTATTIELNPTMGGPGGAGQGSMNGAPGSNSSSTTKTN